MREIGMAITPDHVRCAACGLLIPAAKAVSAKLILSGIGGVVGGVASKSAGWGLVGGALGLLAGALIDEVARPLCGDCQAGRCPT